MKKELNENLREENNKKVRNAIVVANIGALSILVVKLVIGILTNTLSVLSSALDSCLDFFISFSNYFIAKRSHNSVSKTYNFGKGKLQGIGAVVEGMILSCSGIYLIIKAIIKISEKGQVDNSTVALIAMGISISVTFFIVKYLQKIAKETNNLTLKADTFHYKTDLYTNIGIIFSIILIKITGLYIIDSIVTIIIGIYIIYSCKDLFKEGIDMLLDKSLDSESIAYIVETIEDAGKKIDSYHYLKTRKSGDDIFITFHLVFKKKMNLNDAHEIGEKIETKIKRKIENAQVLIHFEPYKIGKKHMKRF